MKKYKQGIYKPLYPKKYRGSLPIIFRSGLELLFFRWCDKNFNVLEWGSESIIIPYLKPTDGRVHKYFVDNNVILKDNKGNIHKYLVEIKPSNQLMQPKSSNRKKPKTFLKEQINFAINQSKWESARQWCNKNGYKFQIITEKELKPKK